jgi:hypothetical protein
MSKTLRSLLLLVSVVAVVVLPSMGPLIDHHYAERQPAHQHLGLAEHHVHGFGQDDAHFHGPETGGTGGLNSTAMFAYEGAPVSAIVTVEADLDTLLDFEPGSLFNLPLPPHAESRQHYTSPQGKPPQLSL